jgi:hypothetical protein
MSSDHHLAKNSLFLDNGTAVRSGGRWGRLHPLLKLLSIMAVLAIMALPFYGSAKKVYKGQRYQSDLAAAKQALAAGQDVKARDLSLALLQREPKKTEALPIFMHAAEGAADSRLAGVARGYLSLDTGDKTDRLYAWQAVARQSPMGISGMTWLDISESERVDPDFLIPWLERLMAEDLGQVLERVLAQQTKQTDPRVERIRLSMLAKRDTEVSWRELQARLWDRLANHPDDGPMLLGALDEIPQAALIPYSFTALGEWIRARGGEPAVEDQLRLARCEMAAHPESTEPVLTRTITAFATRNPLAVAKMCSILGHFDTAKELLEPLVLKGDLNAFKLMAGVLESWDKVDQWDKLLETPAEGVSLPEILCDRAYIAGKRGDQRAQPKFQQEAVAAAELRTKSDSLILLARHASKRGMPEYAKDIWVKAIRKGPASPLPFFASITWVVESLAHNKEEVPLMDVLGTYRVLEPGNVDVVTQYLYLGCLIGNVTPARVLTELSAVRARIHSLQLDCTVALAHVLEGDYGLAEQLTHGDSIDWFVQVPALRAIRAITLTKTGGKEEADIYLEDFPWDNLLPCEARVFRELLDESKEPGEIGKAAKAGETDEAKAALAARQAERAKEIQATQQAIAAMKAKEAGKSEEAKIAERAARIEKARQAEQARQAKRAKEAEEIRVAKEAKAKGTANAGETTADRP